MSLSISEKKGIILANGSNPQRILNILIEMQYVSEEGYIDEETAKLVANHLHLTETRVYELLSYYAILKTEPQARYVLKICNSTPCLFSGGAMLSQLLEELLGVPADEATPDNMFMFHSIPCIGACDKGPVIKIKDTVFSDLTEEKVSKLITNLREGYYQTL